MEGEGVRSLLFVPGDSESKISKAMASEADAVIIDLEDAVAPENKARARDLVRELLPGVARNGKPVLVRLNAFDTGLTAADLAAVVASQPWGVVLPKCGGASDLSRLSHYLEALEAREGVAEGTTRILSVATETAAATLRLSLGEGGASDRLWGLLWGGEDLSASLSAASNRDESGAYTFAFQFARSQCLFAASAAGAVAIDAVFTDFKDAGGLARETRAALRDGFGAKAAIHPAQAAVINAIMTPAPDQLDWARQVVAMLADTGVARLNGKMIDLAHKRIALRLLRRAEELARATRQR